MRTESKNRTKLIKSNLSKSNRIQADFCQLISRLMFEKIERHGYRTLGHNFTTHVNK